MRKVHIEQCTVQSLDGPRQGGSIGRLVLSIFQIGVGMNRGSLSNKVTYTHKHCQRCRSMLYSNLCNEGRPIYPDVMKEESNVL